MRLSVEKGAYAVLAQCYVQEIRGISLVFREMWDSTEESSKVSISYLPPKISD